MGLSKDTEKLLRAKEQCWGDGEGSSGDSHRWSKALAFHQYEIGNHNRVSGVTIADQSPALCRAV